MKFPDDHRWHAGSAFEWKYLWGRQPNGKFYHAAAFRKGGKSFYHCSLDGEFEDISYLDIKLPEDKFIVTHDSKMMNYYSIPGNPWHDHCYSNGKVGLDWRWLSLVLDCGMYVMAQDKEDDRLCDFTLGGRIVKSEFVLENKHFWIQELGAYWTIEPVKEEVIFHSKNGRPYSETGVELIAKGKVIGFGMLERTYKEN